MADRFDRRALIAERLTHSTETSFDDVLARLRHHLPKADFPVICALAARASAESEFARLIEERLCGSSGLILYAELDHSAWSQSFGLRQRAVRMIIGNPMISITMMHEDIVSGLFSPVEILLVENRTGCSIVYMRPSTLIALDPRARLLHAAAEGLDETLAKLVRSVTGDTPVP